MSFMYNPFPFDDPKPVNRPELSKKTIDAVVSRRHTCRGEEIRGLCH